MCRRLVQIFGCVLATVGWAFVASTLAMDYWRVSQTGDQGGSAAIGVAWYWSSLWKDCYVNSVAVVNCVDFEVLWSVESYVQGVRGLLITGLTLSLLATAFSIVGLECTVIGGDKRNNDRMLLTAAVLHFVGGVSDIAGYCLYINSVVSTVVHVRGDPSRLSYVIGTPVCLGLVGGCLIVLGSILYSVTVRLCTRVEYSPSVRYPTVPLTQGDGPYSPRWNSPPRLKSRPPTLPRSPSRSRPSTQSRQSTHSKNATHSRLDTQSMLYAKTERHSTISRESRGSKKSNYSQIYLKSSKLSSDKDKDHTVVIV